MWLSLWTWGVFVFMEAENQEASTTAFESSIESDCLFPFQNVFSKEMENIWILMAAILYNEEYKRKTKKRK